MASSPLLGPLLPSPDLERALLEATWPVFVPPPLVSVIRPRFEFVDALRGFLMCVMAWDHIGHQFTSVRDSPEGPYQYYDNSPRKFLTRTVSHICAPGFFLTMGMSIALFSETREWGLPRTLKHFGLRGLVLLATDYVVDFAHALPKLVVSIVFFVCEKMGVLVRTVLCSSIGILSCYSASLQVCCNLVAKFESTCSLRFS
jgi:uncharacterized membrane protein